MNTQEQLTVLYHALAKANNALNILKFATVTFSLDSSLKTFAALMVDSYYSMHVNLSFIFDGTKDVVNLSQVLRKKTGIKEQDRSHNIKIYDELAKKHRDTISKTSDIRNNAIAHIGKDIKEKDLSQQSQDVQGLIHDLFSLFRDIKGFSIDLNEPLLLNDIPKIRDDLGQRDLWNEAILTGKIDINKNLDHLWADSI